MYGLTTNAGLVATYRPEKNYDTLLSNTHTLRQALFVGRQQKIRHLHSAWWPCHDDGIFEVCKAASLFVHEAPLLGKSSHDTQTAV